MEFSPIYVSCVASVCASAAHRFPLALMRSCRLPLPMRTTARATRYTRRPPERIVACRSTQLRRRTTHRAAQAPTLATCYLRKSTTRTLLLVSHCTCKHPSYTPLPGFCPLRWWSG
jgi:hypothetical protein